MLIMMAELYVHTLGDGCSLKYTYWGVRGGGLEVGNLKGLLRRTLPYSSEVEAW